MFKYAGVVVLYNPDCEVKKNIDSYINNIDKLFVIDNSDNVNKDIVNGLKKNEKVAYVYLDGNKGLAKALKIGCEMAQNNGFNYVLTMDQDSIFDEGAVDTIIEFIEKSKEHYSIVGANAVSVYIDEKTGEKMEAYTELANGNKECNWVMTSGSMMDINDYFQTNGFDENMFIAHVDIDICIQLHNMGGKIIKLKDAKLFQQFGNSKPRRILWKVVHPSFANPIRTYYLFRNQKYLEIKYGNEIKKFINVHLYKFIIKVILFENLKMKKLIYAVKGYLDARSHKMGKKYLS
ncbi:glycosyltransferase [Clostridium sp. 'White wine YQ']|uniref:glycosyltransferase n=1 Tax=Clostridium sp. 'White wine YQ' TaxID=3027474 RepID=UPI002364FE7E|nr:glycosyltransferase [Clostridium sp. 'White wine YQ']MDD7792772.1 glycosyltransferase [Clostridium sp. 'White wine YQ']